MGKLLTVTIENIPEDILNHLWERARFRFNEAGVGNEAGRTDNIVIDAGVILDKDGHHWSMLMADIFIAYAMTSDNNHKQKTTKDEQDVNNHA
jgi:hypothetical protein